MNLKNFREKYASQINKYAELVKNKNHMKLENLSLDFMMSQEATFDEFRECVLTFRKTLIERKEFTTKYITIGFLMEKVERSLVSVPVISRRDVTDNAYFSTNKKFNDWLVNAINTNIRALASFELVPGLIVYKDAEYIRIAFSEQYLGE